MSRFASLAVASALFVSALAGCSSSGNIDCIPEGAASKAVTATGDFDTAPTVTFTAGLTAETTQRSVSIQGSGAQVAQGDTVQFEYTLLNGTTGKEIEKSNYVKGQEAAYPVDLEATTFVGLSKALACSTVGSRVIAVIPNAEGFGDQASSAGLGATDTLVFVIDVMGITPAAVPTAAPSALAEATGTPVDPKPGFPTVTFENGKPTVTIPDGPVPTTYDIETLIQGDGPVVADGATVTVNYHGVDWNSKEVFDSSFDRGEPSTFSTGGVIQGFHDALVGQKVGSRVVVIIPSDLGYGDKDSGAIKAGDTILFVIDILATQ